MMHFIRGREKRGEASLHKAEVLELGELHKRACVPVKQHSLHVPGRARARVQGESEGDRES